MALDIHYSYSSLGQCTIFKDRDILDAQKRRPYLHHISVINHLTRPSKSHNFPSYLISSTAAVEESRKVSRVVGCCCYCCCRSLICPRSSDLTPPKLLLSLSSILFLIIILSSHYKTFSSCLHNTRKATTHQPKEHNISKSSKMASVKTFGKKTTADEVAAHFREQIAGKTGTLFKPLHLSKDNHNRGLRRLHSKVLGIRYSSMIRITLNN